MIEEDDIDQHRLGKGLPSSFPVLLEENEDITIEDIKRMVEKATNLDRNGKDLKQLRQELHELDEIVQDFSRQQDRWKEMRSKIPTMRYMPRHKIDNDRMNKVLMAIMDDHSAKVNQMGSLTQEDIPHLREEWMKSCKDIMQGAPNKLPPLREVNHHIPLIDEKKRYKYHSPRCLDSLKPELMEKIACYMRAGWWEPAQA